MSAFVEKRGKPKKKTKFIVEYHPRNGFDKAWRSLRNKVFHGWRTQTMFETDPLETPHGGRVRNTSIRNGTPLGG